MLRRITAVSSDSRVWGLLGVLIACGACGAPAAEPRASSPTDPKDSSHAPATGEAGPVPPAASADSAEVGVPQARAKRPFSIHNACAETVTLALGEEPSAAEGGVRTLAPNASIDGARHQDGKQTVWLLDDKREPLVKVHVTRGMKTVEVGSSCRTLDAR